MIDLEFLMTTSRFHKRNVGPYYVKECPNAYLFINKKREGYFHWQTMAWHSIHSSIILETLKTWNKWKRFSRKNRPSHNGNEKCVNKVDILRYPNKRSFILSLDTCNQKVGSLTLLPPPLTHPVHTYTLPFWIFAQLILLLRVKFMSYSAKSSLESMKKAGDCVIHAWDEFNQKPASLSLDTAKNGFSDADAAAESWSWTANEQGLSRGFSGILPFSPRSEDTSSSMFSLWRTLVMK